VILVAENLNIISQSIGPALKERRAQPVQELAAKLDKVDVDYIDLNIGPARKGGEELLSWVVDTVQEVTAKPLSLDTTNPQAMEAGLKTCRNKTLINSISLQPVRLEQELPLVNKYNTEMIGLLWGIEGMPRDANERCMLCVDLVYKANECDIPNEKIWIDPIATPVSGEINQLKAGFEFLSMLPEISPGCKSIVGLSNVSNGTPAELRPILNQTFMIMLLKYNIYSAIMDAFDPVLIDIARGRRPDLIGLVQGMMDGNIPDPGSLSPEHLKYYKTFRVLNGDSLYSHLWLEA